MLVFFGPDTLWFYRIYHLNACYKYWGQIKYVLLPKTRGWNTCSGACSYLDATYLLARLGYNGLISSKTSGVHFKTITFMFKLSVHFETVHIQSKSTFHMFISDLKCSSTSRDIAAGFWNRENLENVTHSIFGPWSITGTPWIIHRVMIRSCLRLGDISDILRPSFLQLVTESFPTVWAGLSAA